MISRLKKYLIYRSKKYLWIEELSAGKSLICRSKTDELKIEEAFDLKIEELSADGRTICRSKNCLQIEEVFDLEIKELSADGGIICR